MADFDPGWSALDEIAPALRQYLNVPNLRPLLRAKHLLTDDEFEQVEISSANPTAQAIDRFVSILKTKCPNHAELLLEILKLSLEQEDYYHLGHDFLSKRLEAAILERKATARERRASEGERSLDEDALREAVREIPIPGHSLARQNDSGLGLRDVSASSVGSSQDTGSPRSTFSHASYGDGLSRPLRRLRIRGLDNMENGTAPHHAMDEQQISNLKYKIIKDTINITDRFALMVLGLYRLLKLKDTPVDEVRIVLQFLGCRTSNSDSSDSITMFSGSDDISEAKDLARLIECLRKYSSWYNYRLMKVVAEQFAGEEGKRLISEYEADLRKHYVTLMVYQCPEFTLEQKVPAGFTKLIAKVDWDYMSTNLQDIATFQGNLADILGLEPYVFLLRSAEEGCVRLEWALPAAVEPHVAQMMGEKEECLVELKVTYLEILSAPYSTNSPAKIFIEQPRSRKEKASVDVYLPRHTPCCPSLSSSSSIISLLDQPMSSVEAELLSLYDSGSSSRGGSMYEEGGLPSLPTFPETREENSGEERIQCGGSSTVVEEVDIDRRGFPAQNSGYPRSGQIPTFPSATNLAPPMTTPLHMKRAFCSEGNLLSAPTINPSLHATSLPDIVDDLGSAVGVSTPKKRRCRKIIRSLRKLPRSILSRFLLHSHGKKRFEKDGGMNSTSPTLRPSLFPLPDLEEEPRRIGSRQNISEHTGLGPLLKIDELHISQQTLREESLDSVEGGFIGVSPFLRICTESSVSYSPCSSQADLRLPVATSHRRDSAVPSSPCSSISIMDAPSPVVPRLKGDQGDKPPPDRDSGLDSFRSDSSRPALASYQRQTSFDSVDTASLVSVSTQPSSKRNSYSSHYYVNINPIFEDPDDPHATQVRDNWAQRDSVSFPRYSSDPPQTSSERLSSSESFESRERSCSLNESYVRGVHTHTKSHSSTTSSQSSGYVSFAGSMIQVDSASTQSEGSLEDGACGGVGRYPSTVSPRHYAQNSAPFPSAPVYPGNASVRRGGSLKASVKLSTHYVPRPPLLPPRD